MRLPTLLTVLKVSSRNLFRHGRRSLLALGTIVGGLVAFLLASGFIHWILLNMREATIHSQLGHIQIVKQGYFKDGISDPYAYLLPGDAARIGVPPDLAGVSTLAPRLAFSGMLSRGEETLSFLGEGVDPAREAPIMARVNIVAGQNLSASDAKGIIVGEGLAANLDVKPGDTIVLLANTSRGGINAVEGTVRGIFSTITKAYDDNFLRVPISMARELVRVEGATNWVLLLKDTEATDTTLTRLRQTTRDAGVELSPWYEQADFYNKTVTLFTKQVDVVKLIIAVIIVLSISNTLTMSVLERTSEIGTIMALGTPRRGVLGQYLTEGLLLGVVGGALGIVVGWVLAWLISRIGIPMPPPPGMAHGYIGQIQLTPGLMLDAWLTALVTTLAASVYPAWKASRMNIVDALRHSR
ncbi:MAG: FtsX-like permease family protein [Moraxellaceae bacterium]|nr:FtsX-like permease family protein [Moraxellaceae bacterium]